MILYTIGFTQKSAEHFFEALISNGVQLLVDVRLNTRSQLAGFAKSEDLEYFLRRLGDIDYIYCPNLAPTKELLSGYRKKEVSWDEYERVYRKLMEARGSCQQFVPHFSSYEKICLLCSEAKPEHCHRRLAAEMIAEASKKEITIKHIL